MSSEQALSGSERQQKYKENNKKAVELNTRKQNFARSKLKDNDPEKANKLREEARKRKAAQRSRDKENKKSSENSDSDVATKAKSGRTSGGGDLSDVTLASDDGQFLVPPTPSRQYLAGIRIRKHNQKEKKHKMNEIVDENEMLRAAMDRHDDEIIELDFKIKDLEYREEKSKQKIIELEKQLKENTDEWFLLLYKNLTPNSRKEIRNVMNVIKPQLQRGTLNRIRQNTGINFSILTVSKDDDESELKKKITEFAKRNTIDVPDKKKFIKGVRYRTTSLLCLFNSFQTENPEECIYQTFVKYWPVNYVKPSPSEFGTCLCIICQNMELKIQALQSRKLISNTNYIEDIIMDSRNNDFERENLFRSEIDALANEENKSVDVAFHQWEKVKQSEINKNTGKVKGDKTMRIAKHLTAEDLGQQVLESFEAYKDHLERDSIIKNELKKVRSEANEKDDVAVLHVDWAEQHKLTEIKEIQTAFFNGRYAYDIHTGYCYTKDDNHGFASLSDSSDHRAEAIHVALKPKIVKLVEKGIKRIVICSDSPISQYRNSKNVFLMKKLAQEFDISIRLLFTEAGHGKSPCDGVGGNIKTQVENAMLNDFGRQEIESVHSVEDVKKVIQEKTNLKYEIYIHTKDQIEEVKESMPKLSGLVGALKVHEVVITADGVIKKKDLPSDTFFKQVTIRESRKQAEVFNAAFIEDTEVLDENTNTEQRPLHIRKHIMTAAEIEADLLDGDVSDLSDDDTDD